MAVRGALARTWPLSSCILRLPGLRPGAERRGRPRRAARVMIAATERSKRVEISCGVLFCIHKSRNKPSCSCQLGPANPWLFPAASGPAAEGGVGIGVSISLTRMLQKLKEKLIHYSRFTPEITHNLLIPGFFCKITLLSGKTPVFHPRRRPNPAPFVRLDVCGKSG